MFVALQPGWLGGKQPAAGHRIDSISKAAAFALLSALREQRRDGDGVRKQSSTGGWPLGSHWVRVLKACVAQDMGRPPRRSESLGVPERRSVTTTYPAGATGSLPLLNMHVYKWLEQNP